MYLTIPGTVVDPITSALVVSRYLLENGVSYVVRCKTDGVQFHVAENYGFLVTAAAAVPGSNLSAHPNKPGKIPT